MATRRRRLSLPRVRSLFSREPDPARELASPELGGMAQPAMPPVGGRLNDTFRAFRNRNYRLYYAGQGISLTGTWMQTIAQAWLVIQLTDSKAAVGTVTALQFLPITMFVLFAGVVADRVPKRSFLVATQLLAMAQAAVLAALVWTDTVELWHVYVLAAVLGFANAFEQPTRQSFVVEMVGKEDLMNAVALNSGMFNGARLVGPALGGVMIATAGVETAFTYNALSFIPVIAGLLAMDVNKLKGQPKREASHPLADLRDGISFALRTPAIRLVIIMGAMLGAFGYNFTVALPLIAKYVLDGGAAYLGFLTAALGLGALISALAMASRTRATKFTMFVGALAFTAALGAVAVSQWFLLTLPLLFCVGFASTSFAATANTSLQLAAPDRLRGRVMSVWMLLIAGSTPIGGLFTGYMADRIGVEETLLINTGLCAIGVAAGVAYYITHRNEIEETSEPGRAPQPAAARG